MSHYLKIKNGAGSNFYLRKSGGYGEAALASREEVNCFFVSKVTALPEYVTLLQGPDVNFGRLRRRCGVI